MKIKGKDYGSPNEKFVIELPASELEILRYVWDNVKEKVEFTRASEEMLARWQYSRKFIRPGSIEASEAWQEYLQGGEWSQEGEK